MVFIFDIGNVLIDFKLPLLLETIASQANSRIEELLETWTPRDPQRR